MSDAESHDIKIFTWFPGNSILEILKKICNCVGSANMRGPSTVDVFDLLLSEGLFDFEWTYALSTHVKSNFW